VKTVTVVVVVILALAGCSTTRTAHTQEPTLPVLPAYASPNPAANRSYFEAIVKANPMEKYAWYNLGVIAQGSDPKTAAVDYLRAIAIDPRLEAALYDYGMLRLRANDVNGAITYLRRAVAENPRDANALWNLGLAYARMDGRGADVAARRYLNQALVIDPTLRSALGTTTTVPSSKKL